MESATLDDFMAWNDELHALAEAGVPIHVTGNRTGFDVIGALERINATVARRVSRGASLADALQSDEDAVRSGYGGLVILGLKSKNFAAALAGASRLAESLQE